MVAIGEREYLLLLVGSGAMVQFLKSIKNLIDIISKLSIIKTVYYNYFSRHVIRNNGKLMIYKNTMLYFKKDSRLVVENGILRIGGVNQRELRIVPW